MNTLKYIFGIAFLLIIAVSCKIDKYDDVSFVASATSPGNLTSFFNITQDNSGLVTITPNGEGSSSYDISFGDGTAVATTVLSGKSAQHKYAEGIYDVKIVGHGVTGKLTEATTKLTVSFKAPENFEVSAVIDPSNKFKINVSAKALYETNFKVTYGDVTNEVPVSFLEGATVSHTYTATGTFTIKVVALSGGAASTTFTKTITIVDPVVLPITFESSTIDYSFTNFDGGVVTTIANPKSTGINTSAKVGKMVKGAGQVWGGSWIGLGAPIDFSVNKIFRMKVYSPRIGAKVLFKVENATDASINFEKEVATTKANEWEEMVFNYSAIDATKSYQHIVLIFDNGTVGDGSANYTFLIDDITLTNTLPTGTVQINLPITFDDAAVNYTMTDFGNNQTGDAVDPILATNKVKVTTKANGAETWAGTTMSTSAGFSSKIPLTTTATQMSVRVYSPAAGIKVRLKIEDHTNNTKSVETESVTAAANTWETLIFDFNNQASGTAALNLAYNYDMASIFFDFGNTGTGKKFYWDDVKFLASNVTPNSLGLPLDFESASLNYTFTDFDGGNVTVINNPQSGGLNTSAKVGKMVKNAGQTWGGSWIALANPINFSTGKTLKMNVYSPRVGAKVLLKVENLTDGGISFEKEVATSVANAWEDLTFDYSTINTGLSYQKVVLIFDNGTMGDGTANFTFLFDEIRFVTSTPSATTLYNFETGTYAFTDFNGGVATVIANPYSTGINTSTKVGKMVKNADQTWGGSWIDYGTPIDFSTRKTMKMKVYSPRVGAKVLLKVENATDGAKSFEKEVSTTVANAWEELTFDYSAINTANTYQKVVLIFDNGTMGDGSANFTFLFDDISVN